MRFLVPGLLVGLVALLGCAGEDLSAGPPGPQGGAGASQGGQAGDSAGGQGPAGSGASGVGGQGGAGQGPAGAAGQAGEGAGAAGMSGASGQAGVSGASGQAGMPGISGQAGAGGDPMPTAGQGGVAGAGGQAGSGGAPPQAGSGGATPSGGQAGTGPMTGCTEVGQPCLLDNTEIYGACSDALVCVRSTSNVSGCSDGSREGLKNLSVYKRLAACQGAWTKQGLDPDATGCNRGAGNTVVTEPMGECLAADVCADHWHVCQDLEDVEGRLPANLPSDMPFCQVAVAPASAAGKQAFYATGEGLLGGEEGTCKLNGTYGVVGCGTAPYTNNVTVASGCTPLNAAINPASMGKENLWSFDELDTSKNSLLKMPGPGGVLCCRDK